MMANEALIRELQGLCAIGPFPLGGVGEAQHADLIGVAADCLAGGLDWYTAMSGVWRLARESGVLVDAVPYLLAAGYDYPRAPPGSDMLEPFESVVERSRARGGPYVPTEAPWTADDKRDGRPRMSGDEEPIPF